MRKPQYIISFCLVSLAVLLVCCKEVPPPIDFSEPQQSAVDTTYIADTVETPQARMVLVEEFSGVKCQNCPQGHDKIQYLLTTYPGELNTITLHTGAYGDGLTAPYPGEEDLRITDADDIATILGIAIGIPAAGFDRNEFTTATGTPYLDLVTQWESNFNSIKVKPTKVNINLQESFDAATRDLTITVTLHYTDSVSGVNNISVAITESKIVTTQKDGVLDVFPYDQNHVLRTMVTAATGEIINTTKEPGRVYKRQYVENIPSSWDATELEVVAFVHSVDSVYVLQSAAVHVQ